MRWPFFWAVWIWGGVLLGQEPETGPPQILAGPMVGHVGAQEARLWVWAEGPGWAAAEYRPVGSMNWLRPQRRHGRGLHHRLDEDGLATLPVQNLLPATDYEYRIRTGSFGAGAQAKVHLPASPQTFRTPPLPGQAEELLIGFGSCTSLWGPDPSQPVFRSLNAVHPQAFLWIGDNIYYGREGEEWASPAKMRSRWGLQRAVSHLQPFLRRTSHYAVWDDHDYGPDNSDKTYAHARLSLDLHQRWWANPGAGSGGEPGVWHRFRRGRVEFFLLDLRSHRDPDLQVDSMRKTQLGAEQWAWLEQGLRQSDADFKGIISSVQVLATHHDFESWSMFPEDRARLFGLLEEAQISGVFLLSGDRHIGEVLVSAEAGLPYPLYEFTASPLAAGVGDSIPDAAAPERVPGSLVATEHFGLLRFSFVGPEPTLRFEARDVSGRVVGLPITLTLSALR